MRAQQQKMERTSVQKDTSICLRESGLERSAPVRILMRVGFSTTRIAKMSTVDFLILQTMTTILVMIWETLKEEREEEKAKNQEEIKNHHHQKAGLEAGQEAQDWQLAVLVLATLHKRGGKAANAR